MCLVERGENFVFSSPDFLECEPALFAVFAAFFPGGGAPALPSWKSAAISPCLFFLGSSGAKRSQSCTPKSKLFPERIGYLQQGGAGPNGERFVALISSLLFFPRGCWDLSAWKFLQLPSEAFGCCQSG